MRRALIIAAAIASIASPVRAQQPDTSNAPPSSTQGPDSPSEDSNRGPNYPKPGSGRGPNYPKGVSPTDSNPTNWIVQEPEYTDPYEPNNRWNRGRAFPR